MHYALLAITAHDYARGAPAIVVSDPPQPPMTIPHKRTKPRGEPPEAWLKAEAKRIRKMQKRLDKT